MITFVHEITGEVKQMMFCRLFCSYRTKRLIAKGYEPASSYDITALYNHGVDYLGLNRQEKF